MVLLLLLLHPRMDRRLWLNPRTLHYLKRRLVQSLRQLSNYDRHALSSHFRNPNLSQLLVWRPPAEKCRSNCSCRHPILLHVDRLGCVGPSCIWWKHGQPRLIGWLYLMDSSDQLVECINFQRFELERRFQESWNQIRLSCSLHKHSKLYLLDNMLWLHICLIQSWLARNELMGSRSFNLGHVRNVLASILDSGSQNQSILLQKVLLKTWWK